MFRKPIAFAMPLAAACAAGALALGAAFPAFAHDGGHGWERHEFRGNPHFRPHFVYAQPYYAPRPVVVVPPPRVVYAPPPAVYYTPAPVYYTPPAAVYYTPPPAVYYNPPALAVGGNVGGVSVRFHFPL